MPEKTVPIPAAQKKRKHNFLPGVVLVSLCLWIASSRVLVIPHPPVGLYIGVLACLAAVVTLWPSASAWARAGWFVVFGAFLVLEITTLYEQRAEDAETAKKDQVAENNRFVRLMKVQQDSFAAVLQRTQQEFEMSMRRSNSILRKTEEAISFTSGGDCFPVVFPYEATENSGVKELGFSLSKQGKYPLISS